MNNKIEGDLLFIILDACRFDTFINAKIPNFRKIGGVSKAYSPACWTVASIPSYLYGCVPLGYYDDSYTVRKGRYGFERFIKNHGNYWFGFYSPNPIIDELKPLMSRYDIIRTTEYPLDKPTCSNIFNDIIKDIKEKGDKPYNISTLFMETHPPIWNGKKHISDPKKQFESQIKAVEYVDKQFGKFLDKFELRKPTKVVITSDHGELMGERNEKGGLMYGHDPRNNNLTFHSKLFEIPYIEGIYS